MLFLTSCSFCVNTSPWTLTLLFCHISLPNSWHFISEKFISFLKGTQKFFLYKERIKWRWKKKERKGGGPACFPSMMNKQMQKLSHQVPHFKTSNGAIAVFSSDSWNYMERSGKKLNYAIRNSRWNLKFPGRSLKFCGWFYQIPCPKLKVLSTP